MANYPTGGDLECKLCSNFSRRRISHAQSRSTHRLYADTGEATPFAFSDGLAHFRGTAFQAVDGDGCKTQFGSGVETPSFALENKPFFF